MHECEATVQCGIQVKETNGVAYIPTPFPVVLFSGK